jgi:hypothetical protein
MRAQARRQLEGVPLYDGEMSRLGTHRTYSAVICMFSTIGYAASRGELRTAIANMAARLEPGGVLVVEPWIFPDRYVEGHVGNDHIRTPDREIVRMSHSGRQDNVSVLTMHYLVGAADGIVHFSDVHMLSMFTRGEFIGAFKAARCDLDYAEPGFGRGLFIGVRRR